MKPPEEFEAHLASLRTAGAQDEIRLLARRFVERAKGADTIRLFTPEEIRIALDEIESSARSVRFVDPVRLRMYRRYLQQTAGRA